MMKTGGYHDVTQPNQIMVHCPNLRQFHNIIQLLWVMSHDCMWNIHKLRIHAHYDSSIFKHVHTLETKMTIILHGLFACL